MNKEICYRNLEVADLDIYKDLVIKHGTTKWSNFPIDDLNDHVCKLKSGIDRGIVALYEKTVVGVITFSIGDFYKEYIDARSRHRKTGYIIEIIVNPKFRGRDIGTKLVLQANSAILASGKIDSIFARRHEENKSSKAVLHKAGYQTVDVFPDSHRTTGSGRTALEKYNQL